MADQPDIATVIAARNGDPAAVDRLVAGYLPLVYTIVGRALEGHADVDDVVQDVMLRVLRNLGDLREPEAFRSWLVAITVRQVRERYRARRGAPEALVHEDIRDPGADFTDLAITRLELSGQRRETAEATRWLDEDNRELLSLWWLEASGELTRDEIVAATDVTRQHAAVRVQRMKGQLETARVVVRALAAQPTCPELRLLTVQWDGRPGALWRKRIARHTRDCSQCAPAWHHMVAAERLLAGMALIPIPAAMAGKVVIAKTATGGGAHLAAKIGFSLSRKVLTAALSTTAVAGTTAAVVVVRHDSPPARAEAAVVATSPAPRPAPTTTTPSPSPSPSKTPSKKPVVITAKASKKKGVSVWKFTGLKAALADVGAGWYYNWAPNNNDVPGPAGVEFVPMIWGKANVTDATLAQAKKEGDELLGFNEPDMGGQANMSVEDALAAWPELQDTGMRLGSPAVAYGGRHRGRVAGPVHDRGEAEGLPGRLHHPALVRVGLQRGRGRPVPRLRGRRAQAVRQTDLGHRVRPDELLRLAQVPDRGPGGGFHQGQHQGHAEPLVRGAVRLVRAARGGRQRRLRPLPGRGLPDGRGAGVQGRGLVSEA